MNRTASIRITGLNFTFIKDNFIQILLLFLTLIAMLCGVCFLKNEVIFKKAEEYFTEYLTIRQNNDFFKTFLYSLLGFIQLPVISFLCGTSALGLILSPITVVIGSFWYGSVVGFVYTTYGLSGIVFNLFVLLLPSLVLFLILHISVKESVTFSRLITTLCIKDTRAVNLYRDFKIFCIKHLILILPIILGALLDVSLFNLFSKYLNF